MMNGLDPSAWLMMNQAAQLKPDQAQVPQGQIPPMLQSNEVYNQQAPKPASTEVPQAPPPPALGAYLKQKPQVMMAPEPRPDRSMMDARTGGNDRMAKEANAGQDASLEELQGYINDLKAQPVGVDWTPLAGYIDSVVPGSKLSQAALTSRGLTQDEKNKQILALQQNLVKQKAQFATENRNALYQQQNFERQLAHDQETERFHRAEINAQMAKGDGQGLRAGVMQDGLIDRAVKGVNDDKQLTNYRQRIDGADRILGQLGAARSGKMVDTSQLLNDINTEYVNLLTGANNSALGKQERTEYSTAAAKLASVKQQLTATPQSINSPDILKQVETGVRELRNNYSSLTNSRLDKLHVDYTHTPEATRQRDQAIADTRAQYGQPLPEEHFDEDVVRYAKTHGISNEAALKIKIDRTK